MANAARTPKNSSHRLYSPRQLDDQSEERQALLDEARAGSKAAHDALLTQCHATMVCYFAQRLSPRLAAKANEDDLAQEVCLQAVRTFAKQFRGATVAEYWGWLMAICRNVLHALERMFGPGSDRDLSREELLDELRLAMESQHPYARRQPTPDEIARGPGNRGPIASGPGDAFGIRAANRRAAA